MKTYLKEKVLKHVKWFVLIFILCFVYAFISLNGWQGISNSFEEEKLTEVAVEVSGKKIVASIPQTENLIIEISELEQKQETVKLSFYNKDDELVKEEDCIFRVGYNNIGKLDEEIAYMKYVSNRDISVSHMYLAQGYYLNWQNLWYVVVGLFVLCMIQEIIILVKKKYAN